MKFSKDLLRKGSCCFIVVMSLLVARFPVKASTGQPCCPPDLNAVREILATAKQIHASMFLLAVYGTMRDAQTLYANWINGNTPKAMEGWSCLKAEQQREIMGNVVRTYPSLLQLKTIEGYPLSDWKRLRDLLNVTLPDHIQWIADRLANGFYCNNWDQLLTDLQAIVDYLNQALGLIRTIEAHVADVNSNLVQTVADWIYFYRQENGEVCYHGDYEPEPLETDDQEVTDEIGDAFEGLETELEECSISTEIEIGGTEG